MTTPILALQEIAEGVASQASLHNQALRELEARSVRVLSMTTTSPPGSPAEGDSYIIPGGSPMSWLGAANQIAVYLGAVWTYYTPVEGVTVWVNDLNGLYTYNGAAWDATVAATSPLTTKGDVYSYSTVNARLGVGANDTVLTADSAQATGLKWAAPVPSPIKWGGTATYSGNIYLLAPVPAVLTHTNNDTYLVYINNQNSSNTPSMRVDAGLGTVPTANPDGSAVTVGQIKTGFHFVTYLSALPAFVFHRSAHAVNMTGAQTIADVKTFSSPIVIPDAVATTDGVTLRQVPRENLFINAGMRVAQRGTSFAAVATGAYTLDRWVYQKVGAMVHTISQDTDVPTVAQAGMLIPYSFKLVLTTADTALAAGDYCTVSQRVEGYDYQWIAQRSFTLGFWVKATVAGVYSVSFTNSVPDRSYVSNFTISSANTWEYKTITVSASPSAGTWLYTNGLGMAVNIVLAAGTTFHTTANAWQTGAFHGTASNINGVNTGSTNFWFAAPTLNPGTVAASYELPKIWQEMANLQRYFWKTFPVGVAPATGAGYTGAVQYLSTTAGVSNFDYVVWHPTEMRAYPSVVSYNPVSANALWRNLATAADSGAMSVVGGDAIKTACRNPQVAGDGVQQNMYFHGTFDAEL